VFTVTVHIKQKWHDCGSVTEARGRWHADPLILANHIWHQFSMNGHQVHWRN